MKIQLYKIAFILSCWAMSNTNATATNNTNELDDNKDIKLALLLDTSNSMDGLISQAKSQLWAIVNKLSTAKHNKGDVSLQIALYEYGNDNLPAKEQYIRMVTPLTNDLDKISEDLFALKTKGGNEFCGAAIHTALQQLDWKNNKEDLQMIFIAGNEPFDQGNTDYIDACLSAKNHEVIINTIYCGDFNEGINGHWKKGADIGNGEYISIDHNSKTIYIPSPYDDRIEKLNTQLNDTYLPYGSLGWTSKLNQNTQDYNASSLSKKVIVERGISKGNGFYKNESWDLVDASEEDGFEIENLEQLPEEMSHMNTEEKLLYIKEKKSEREAIQQEIQSLSKKRDQYLAKLTKNDEKSLEQAIINMIEEQAQNKAFLLN